MAEEIEEKVGQLKQRRTLVAVGVFVFLGAIAALLALWFPPTNETSALPDGELTAIAVSVGLYGSIGALFLYNRKEIRRETKAREETMTVVHEVYESLKSSLSPLKQAE